MKKRAQHTHLVPKLTILFFGNGVIQQQMGGFLVLGLSNYLALTLDLVGVLR